MSIAIVREIRWADVLDPTREQGGLLNKSSWGPGPWQEEPDKIQGVDEATGLPVLAVRNHHGNWCGYAGVAEGHPAFGLDHDKVDHLVPPDEDGDRWIKVHGGLTYSDFCQEGEHAEEIGICHIPQEGQPERVWWVGFDCHHAGDLAPGMEARTRALFGEIAELAPAFLGAWRDVYRPLPYVLGELECLAAQLAAIGGAA